MHLCLKEMKMCIVRLLSSPLSLSIGYLLFSVAKKEHSRHKRDSLHWLLCRSAVQQIISCLVIQSQTTQSPHPSHHPPPPPPARDLLLQPRLVCLLLGPHIPVKKAWLRAYTKSHIGLVNLMTVLFRFIDQFKFK